MNDVQFYDRRCLRNSRLAGQEQDRRRRLVLDRRYNGGFHYILSCKPTLGKKCCQKQEDIGQVEFKIHDQAYHSKKLLYAIPSHRPKSKRNWVWSHPLASPFLVTLNLVQPWERHNINATLACRCPRCTSKSCWYCQAALF